MSSLNDYPWVASYPSGIAWDATLPIHPVGDLLDATARRYGDRPGFDFLGRKTSWAVLSQQVNKLAKGLQMMGVQKGQRVGLFLPNAPTFLISYYALMKIGAIVVNFNPLYSEKEVAHQINDSGVEIMVTLDLAALHGKMVKMLGQTCLKTLIVDRFDALLPFPKNILFRVVKASERASIPDDAHHIRMETLMENDGVIGPVDIDPYKDIALLQYTGGTTGTPKGAMLTHANLIANVEQVVLWFKDARPGQEKMVGVIPFFHIFAMTAVMNLGVRLAFEIYALPRFDLQQTLNLINKHKPHFFPAVPAIFNAINNHPQLKSYDLTSLRYCVSGGAPLPAEVKRSFERSTGCVLVEGYGLTESSPVVCVNPIEGANKPASIGLPLPGTVVEIISTEDRATIMPTGERGELCVRGPQVMKGYWNKPEDSADVLRNGRLHTGDVAYIDNEGYVFIVDRIKDVIITNGYKVFPRNVEEAIYRHPDVEECIVAGLPDTDRGEIVKAWIKPKAGRDMTVEQIKTWLKDALSPIEMPKIFDIREQPLPKTMIGKLSRKDVLAEESSRLPPG